MKKSKSRFYFNQRSKIKEKLQIPKCHNLYIKSKNKKKRGRNLSVLSQNSMNKDCK